MTQQEKQEIDKKCDEFCEYRRTHSSGYPPREWFMAGVKALDELHNAEKPSEDLVEEIYDLIEKYHYDEYAIWSVEDSMRCSTEIANIVTQRESELLEAAKDALTTFYGIGCTDEADIVQALKKAISNY
jgi:hypothetical protein